MGMVVMGSQLLNRHEWRRSHKGNQLPICQDLLRSMGYWRWVKIKTNRDDQYISHREKAMRPVLGQMRMIESAIRMDIAGRNALAAWQKAMDS